MGRNRAKTEDRESGDHEVEESGKEHPDDGLPFGVALGVEVDGDIGDAEKDPGGGADSGGRALRDHADQLGERGDGKDDRGDDAGELI